MLVRQNELVGAGMGIMAAHAVQSFLGPRIQDPFSHRVSMISLVFVTGETEVRNTPLQRRGQFRAVGHMAIRATSLTGEVCMLLLVQSPVVAAVAHFRLSGPLEQ